MKTTKVLLLGAVVAAFSFTTLAGTGAALLKASATSTVSRAETPANTVAYVASSAASVSPRAQANQIKVVQGMASDRNPALECRNTMVASPRAVAACAQSVTMPGCMKLAAQ